MLPRVNSKAVKIARAARISRVLEKLAAHDKNAAALKASMDAEIFGYLAGGTKTAAVGTSPEALAQELADVGVGVYTLDKVAQRQLPDMHEIEDAVQKLATVGFIEGVLNQLQAANLSADAIKHAAEVRAFNRSYGVRVLNELQA